MEKFSLYLPFLKKEFCFKTLLLSITILFLCFCFTLEGRAEFRVCNATQSIVGVAVGYRNQKGWHSEGWWRISPSYCATVIEAPLEARYYYLHVENAKNDGQWEGAVSFCVKDEQFSIDGTENCFIRGYQRAGFQEIDTGAQTRWTVQLTEEEGQDSKKSQSLLNAGVP